jgi:REP element-mobilizing transposase RayT
MNSEVLDDSNPMVFTRKTLFVFMKEIENILSEQSKRHRVRILGAANSGNHLHLVIHTAARSNLISFLKAFSGRVAQIVHGDVLERARKKFSKSFWEARPYSRLVNWGKDLKSLLRCIGINSTETDLGMSREATRSMFSQIFDAIRSGLVVKAPNLVAAGFG